MFVGMGRTPPAKSAQEGTSKPLKPLSRSAERAAALRWVDVLWPDISRTIVVATALFRWEIMLNASPQLAQ